MSSDTTICRYRFVRFIPAFLFPRQLLNSHTHLCSCLPCICPSEYVRLLRVPSYFKSAIIARCYLVYPFPQVGVPEVCNRLETIFGCSVLVLSICADTFFCFVQYLGSVHLLYLLWVFKYICSWAYKASTPSQNFSISVFAPNGIGFIQ